MPKEVKVQIGKEIPPNSVKVPVQMTEGAKNVAVLAVLGLWGVLIMLVCCACGFLIDAVVHILGPEWVRLAFMTVGLVGILCGLFYAGYAFYRNRRGW